VSCVVRVCVWACGVLYITEFLLEFVENCLCLCVNVVSEIDRDRGVG